MSIKFQNENLIAFLILSNGDEHLVGCVPDLICVVDSDRFEPLLTEDLKYGLRVTVILIPSVPLMCTE